VDEETYRRFEAMLDGAMTLPGDAKPRGLLKAKNKACAFAA
jgi:hypothetical protein